MYEDFAYASAEKVSAPRRIPVRHISNKIQPDVSEMVGFDMIDPALKNIPSHSPKEARETPANEKQLEQHEH